MRLTLCLCRKSMVRLNKLIWKTRGVVRVAAEPEQWYLKDKTVIDPNLTIDTSTGLHKNVDESAEKPIPYPLSPEKNIKNRPNYHEEHVYEYNNNTRLMEGLKHACLLSKTKPIFELPQRIQDQIGSVEIPGQDELVQRYIMQANIWDPTKDKLPRRLDRALPGWHYKAEFGIPQKKIRQILMHNLIRLCRTLGGQYPDLLLTRTLLLDPFMSTSYMLQEYPIIVKGTQDWLMSSTRPLDPYATPEEVEQTTEDELPDLYPLIPTIDLQRQHLYKEETITGYKEGFRFSSPHTLFMTTVQNRRLEEHQARMLMLCFGRCLATAKAKYGNTVKELPEPITIQCVHSDSAKFNFACFQLNTIDFSDDAGIKNLVWFDSNGNHEMYNKILPKRAMLRNTRYEDYDPEVFQKILAFYIAGADLDSVSERVENVA